MFASSVKKIGDLKRCIEFTQAELVETKALLKCQDGELKKLSEKVNKSESETLAEKVRIIEDNSRKNNVIFNSIPEAVTETPEHLLENVGQILTRKLNVASDVEYCLRLGGKIDSGRHSAVLVILKNSAVQRSCLRESYMLNIIAIFDIALSYFRATCLAHLNLLVSVGLDYVSNPGNSSQFSQLFVVSASPDAKLPVLQAYFCLSTPFSNTSSLRSICFVIRHVSLAFSTTGISMTVNICILKSVYLEIFLLESTFLSPPSNFFPEAILVAISQ